jgi:hypothetical protein
MSTVKCDMHDTRNYHSGGYEDCYPVACDAVHFVW